MAVAVVAHIEFAGTFGASGSVTSSTIDTTGATFLAVAVSHASITTLSDSKANTWTLLRRGTTAGLVLDFYVAVNPTVGSGHTFTVTDGFPSAYVIAMSGLYAVQDLATGAPANFGNGVTSVSTSAFTPKYDNCLILTALCSGNAVISSISVNGLFAITDSFGGVNGQSAGGALAWQQQSTASSVTPTWSWTTSADVVIECLVFATPPSGSGSAGGAYPFVG